jgi:glycosyltransferase involved in cell wall biosynthesis
LKKILFVHNGNEKFIQIDKDLLAWHFEIDDLYLQKLPALLSCRILQRVKSADLVFGWFASWHTFLPFLVARVLRKPSILVIGGYDLANEPEIGYGHQRGGIKKWIARATMSLAGQLVTNSHYSQAEAEHNAGIPSHKVKMIYHGVPDPFQCLPVKPSDGMVLTVGKVDRPDLFRKGLEPFVRTAAQFPELPFVLVGAWADDAIDDLKAIATPNVIFTGWITDTELQEYYRRASIYVQASVHEGFGMSVAEAMLAGCIPVATRVGSLPEVVGDCGEYCDSTDPSEIGRAIQCAMIKTEAREAARNRILAEFPIMIRQQALSELISSEL